MSSQALEAAASSAPAAPIARYTKLCLLPDKQVLSGGGVEIMPTGPLTQRDRQMTEYNLERFVETQDGVFETALAEVRKGRKTSHWMWFIFPQMRGLGSSTTSQFYGIGSLDEAGAYLAHPVLGPRLRQITEALQDLVGTTAEQVFGSVDAQKLRSSLTLFTAVDGDESIFSAALERWFQGQQDGRTLELLKPHDG